MSKLFEQNFFNKLKFTKQRKVGVTKNPKDRGQHDLAIKL